MDYSDCLGYQLGFCRFRCTKPESCDNFKSKYVRGDSCSFENSFDIFYTTEEEAQRALKGNNKEAKK